MMTSRPRLSVVIATLNEERHIEQCIRSVLEGTLPRDQVEILVADGGSTDRTRKIVEDLAREFPCVRLIENPKRITPVAFNLAIKASRGQTICIMSAHCYADPNYHEVCLKKLEELGVDGVGGAEVTVASDDTIQVHLVEAVLSSRFGVGSNFRTTLKEGPSESINLPIYRREVFDRVGLFDERLVRNQDNEFNSRLCAAGARFWMVPTVNCYYYSRSTIRKLLHQNFQNGLYGILTWRVNPASFNLRHATPLAFVLFLIFGALASLLHPLVFYAYLGMLGLYAILAVIASIQQGVKRRMPVAVVLPVLFLALHVAYGLGTLGGVFRFGLRRSSAAVSAK